MHRDRRCKSSGSDLIKLGDDWLAANVPTILASQAYQSGVLFILFDEGTRKSEGPLAALVLSPYAKAGYSNSIRYDHGSFLKTVQDIFHLPNYLGAAQQATSMGDLFQGPFCSAGTEFCVVCNDCRETAWCPADPFDC